MLLAAAACLLTLAAAPLPHVDSDAALFGKVAKQILASGEWLTLHHPGKPDWIVDKPPLTFWLMAVSLRVGGETNAALRAWQLLMQIGLVFAVYRLARLSAGREESLLAGLLMATFQQAFYFSMAPQHDVPVTLFLTLAFYGSLAYRERGSTVIAILIGFLLALAALTKGVLWVGVFALIVIVDAALAARHRDLGRWRWGQVAVAAAVCVIVAAPWFVVGAVRQGGAFVETFLLGENGIQRFLHPFLGAGVVPVRGRLVLLLAYVPILMLGMLPWTGWLPGAVRAGWLSLRAGPRSVRLCAVWFGVFFLVLSLSQGDRIMRYLLPLYPPLAVLAARWTVRAFEEPRGLRMAAAISLVFGVPLIVATGWFYFLYAPNDVRVYLPILMPSMIVFSLALTAFAMATFLRPGRRAVVVLVTGVLVSYALLYGMLMQRWETIWPWPAITGTVNRLYRLGDRVLVVGSAGAETHFAAYWIEARVEAADEDVLMAAWQKGRVFGLLSPQTAARLSERLHPTVLVTTPLGWTLVTNR
jgi:4-amino-4-deoxy-L-arabinose transferase-like glycosyltransferase